MSWIFIVADVKPRPSIECTFAHPSNVVRHQIVSQTVALIGRTIQIPGRRVNGKTHAVADAGGEHTKVVSIRIEHQYCCTFFLASQTCAYRIFSRPRLKYAYQSS